jgi:hypothetical protein
MRAGLDAIVGMVVAIHAVSYAPILSTMVIRLGKICIGLAFGAVAAALFAFDPVRVNVLPVCPFHQLTGLWCPGCGTTRALHQLLHGNIAGAFRFNALSMAVLPVAGYLMVRGDASTLKPGWIWLLLAVIVAFGVLRNIPVYPFTLLAP